MSWKASPSRLIFLYIICNPPMLCFDRPWRKGRILFLNQQGFNGKQHICVFFHCACFPSRQKMFSSVVKNSMMQKGFWGEVDPKQKGFNVMYIYRIYIIYYIYIDVFVGKHMLLLWYMSRSYTQKIRCFWLVVSIFLVYSASFCFNGE